MSKAIILLVLGIFCLPGLASAAVLFNEVAWMGIDGTNGSYGEWIELFNNGSEAVDLTDWSISEDGGERLVIRLVGSISAGSYYLVERVTPSVPDPVPGVNDLADSFGGSGLANTGENLVLKNASGETISSLDASAGWPAGDSVTKETMQWTGSEWITATGTPGQANASTGSVVDDGGTSDDDDDDSGGGGDSGGSDNPSGFSLSLVKKQVVTVGTPLKLRAKISKKVAEGLGLTWSFGDGASGTGVNIEHTYAFPGVYVVTVNGVWGDHQASAKTEVLVIDPDVDITEVVVDGKARIELANQTAYDLDMGGWRLQSASSTFYFPVGMVIRAKGVINIPNTISLLSFGERVDLILPSGESVSVFELKSLDQAAARDQLLVIQAELEEAKVELAQITAAEVTKTLEPVFESSEIVSLPPPVESIPVDPPAIKLPSGLKQAAGPGLIELPHRNWMDWVSFAGFKKMLKN